VLNSCVVPNPLLILELWEVPTFAIAEQSDERKCSNSREFLAKFFARTPLSQTFVAPAACLIESDCCGRECRESAWAEPSRSRMGLAAGWLLRRIGCGWIANSVHSMLAGRCWDAREWTFSPRTLRSIEGLDRRARPHPTSLPRPRSSRAFVRARLIDEPQRRFESTYVAILTSGPDDTYHDRGVRVSKQGK
jgi:hypothetical protein